LLTIGTSPRNPRSRSAELRDSNSKACLKSLTGGNGMGRRLAIW
jgi:hypothetical protein